MLQVLRDFAQRLFGRPRVRFSGTPIGIGIDPDRPRRMAKVPKNAPWLKPDHKRTLLDLKYGTDIPPYQWYWLGPKPTNEQVDAAREAASGLFGNAVGFGDIELHYSSTDATLGHKILRVRGADRRAVELQTPVGTFPLFLANGGNSFDPRFIDFTELN